MRAPVEQESWAWVGSVAADMVVETIARKAERAAEHKDKVVVRCHKIVRGKVWWKPVMLFAPFAWLG
jgi:hypothetical protein